MAFGFLLGRTQYDHDFDKALVKIRASPQYDAISGSTHITHEEHNAVFPVNLSTAAKYLARHTHRLATPEEVVSYKADFDARTKAIEAELSMTRKARPQPLESLSAALEQLLKAREEKV